MIRTSVRRRSHDTRTSTISVGVRVFSMSNHNTHSNKVACVLVVNGCYGMLSTSNRAVANEFYLFLVFKNGIIVVRKEGTQWL